eukprot:COSAG06_NODE_681_length_13133_cov_6.625547_11_plen_421_part_00
MAALIEEQSNPLGASASEPASTELAGTVMSDYTPSGEHGLLVHAGDAVTVLRTEPDWAWVRSAAGQEGWVPRAVLKLSQAEQWDLGDLLLWSTLLLIGALIGARLLGLYIRVGWRLDLKCEGNTTKASECTSHYTCMYEPGAIGLLHGLEFIDALWVSTKEDCCATCIFEDCSVATFLTNRSYPDALITPNCVLFSNASEPVFTKLDTRPHNVIHAKGAILCRPVADVAEIQASKSGWFESWLESILAANLGGAVLLVRFKELCVITGLGWIEQKILRAVGYGGASLVSTVLAPRKAAEAARSSAANNDRTIATRAAASWQAIAARSEVTPSTWTEARLALGLSVRQAIWSCGIKLLFWHWVQPLSYFTVFAWHYCSLSPTMQLIVQQTCGIPRSVLLRRNCGGDESQSSLPAARARCVQ